MQLSPITGGSSVSLGSSRIRGSLGSVSSAELGSPSLESMSADSSPMHRSCPGDASKTGNEEAGSSREELDQEDEKESEKIKKSDEDVTAGNKEKRKDSGSVNLVLIFLKLQNQLTTLLIVQSRNGRAIALFPIW
jgi:hypothetical protein